MESKDTLISRSASRTPTRTPTRTPITSIRHSGSGLEPYSYEDEEEVTLVKRVTNIFRTTITSKSSNSSNTPNMCNSSRHLDHKHESNWCFPLFFIIPLLAILSYFAYQSYSSPLRYEFNGSSSAFNEMFSQFLAELKLIKSDLKDLNLSVSNNAKRINQLEDSVEALSKNCCKNHTYEINQAIDLRLNTFVFDEIKRSNDLVKENLEKRLNLIEEAFEQRFSKKYSYSQDNLDVEEIKNMIREAIAIYDADKTGEPDYALEPAGGTVINTRCSETFDPYGIQYKVFGIPLWTTSVSPRAVIQPNISPGECWAFKGTKGYLVIKLSQMIIPSAFSYEHIPKQISRDGNINSAPKEFQVRGLADENDKDGHILGNYVYEDNSKPMQYFLVQDPNPQPFQLIELVIVSNHGQQDYTCLYRFRVHGKRVN